MLEQLALWLYVPGDVICGLATQLILQTTVLSSAEKLNQSEPEGGGPEREEAGLRHTKIRTQLCLLLTVLRFQMTSLMRTSGLDDFYVHVRK